AQEPAAELLLHPPPEAGQEVEAVLDEFDRHVAPYPFGQGHPRFWGFVNPPPTPIGILAEALAAAMNSSCGGGNHAAYYVERQVVRWFQQIVGFPEEGTGLPFTARPLPPPPRPPPP